MYYETVFIVNPDTSQENAEKLTDDLVTRVEAAGGRIVKREAWGVRRLAYPIAKRKRGHYMLLVTDGPPSAVAALERAIHLEERIIRFLTVRLTELSDQPSPLMRRRAKSQRTATPEQKSGDGAGERERNKSAKAAGNETAVEGASKQPETAAA